MIPLMKTAFFHEYEAKEALADFIRASDRLSMGEQCFLFEKEFAAFHGLKHAILFNSGGSANLAMFQSFKNLGLLTQGDKVGFSALTWSTNVMPIIQMGFEPVPIDCDPRTLNVMSHNLLAYLQNADLQCFFITNALGFCGDLDVIKKICDEKGILLVEDNCEALGTELLQGQTGTFGKAASFSFFVAHHMSTIEGGMVCTDDDETAEMLRIVRANGWDRNLTAAQQHKWRKEYNIVSEFEAKYAFYDLGFNLRPTEITGFLGRFQLQYLPENIKARENHYNHLAEFLAQNDDLVSLDRSHITLLSNFSFPVLCKTEELKDQYLSQFAGAGVEVRPMIAGNIQRQPFYQKYVAKTFDLPGTDQIHQCGFYCGNYPELTCNDLETLASCISKY